MNSLRSLRSRRAFTLVELACVVVIVGILATLTVPTFRKIIAKTESVACLSNLRQIGIAVQAAVNDNNGRYPLIETDPTDPVYPPEAGAKSLLQTLEPYGINAKVMQCPADLRHNNRYAEKGSSYEWRPLIDDEPAVNPEVFGRWGTRVIRPSRFRLVIDVDPVHNGRQNRLYADGSVRGY
jgi:prepilin-type N-terminal cleavage/methylation domain-containing protein/prepilin-type processing-associated H-X9-DG protein